MKRRLYLLTDAEAMRAVEALNAAMAGDPREGDFDWNKTKREAAQSAINELQRPLPVRVYVGFTLAELGALVNVNSQGLGDDAQDRAYLGGSVRAALRGVEKISRAYGAAMNEHRGRGIASRRKR